MDLLIYSFAINEATIKLIKNSLGYCVYVIIEFHTNIFINTSLDESLMMMQYLMNLFS